MLKHLRTPSLLLGALVLLSSSNLCGDSGEQEVDFLQRIQSTDPERHAPLWLSASEATQDGHLKWEEFSRGGKAILDAKVRMAGQALESGSSQIPDDGCATWTRESKRHGYIPNKTLKELATHFDAIYRGRVAASTEGFIDGWPGTLYEVDVENAPRPSPERIYVYYPIARIQAEGMTLCHQGDRFPDQPEIGRQILVFARQSETGSPLILSPQDEEIFFEREDGTVSLPNHYGEPQGTLTIEVIEKRAHQLAQTANQGAP